MVKRYDYRNCQSLFGYAQEVHRRSGGVCQLCDAGAGDDIDFDQWRQLTVEHLIGTSQGGDYKSILTEVRARFPQLPNDEAESLAERLEIDNMVTACSFCNSTTSRNRNERSMAEVMASVSANVDAVVGAIRKEAQAVLERKRADVSWKLEAIRERFDSVVRPELASSRGGQITTP